MRNGFLRVASCAPHVIVADVDYNLSQILAKLDEFVRQKVELALFPEMSLTGYTCGDLFHNRELIEAAQKALLVLADYSANHEAIDFVVGLPICYDGAMYNCAALLRGGAVTLVPKSYVPNYNEFYERRWWRPMPSQSSAIIDICSRQVKMETNRIFESHGTKIGIEICEDLWVPIPPSCRLAMAGASVILNLSASDDLIGKYDYLLKLISQQSARCLCAYVYAGAGWGESSTDLVFDGKAIIAENGSILTSNSRWEPSDNFVIADIDIEALDRDRMHITTFADCAERECHEISTEDSPKPKPRSYSWTEADTLIRRIDPHPFVPSESAAIDERCDEILNIQVAGLAKRLDAIKCNTLVVGISGGLDSTLALIVAVKTFDRLGLDRKKITGVTMPGFGTTKRTHDNAASLMDALGVTSTEIPIAASVYQHFKDIGHDPSLKDVTYENCQARERTQILMDLSNRLGGIVLGTSDLSELALGWATYNGDHMSMYGVNAGVPKTLVKHLVGYYASRPDTPANVRELLIDIIETPISPELIPAAENGEILQKTEDLVGPYELHDFFLYYMLRYGFTTERIYLLARHAFTTEQYDDDTIHKWLNTFMRRFFQQQFKRSCLPDGPKVGSVCLSPRGDWRMPSDASSNLWRR